MKNSIAIVTGTSRGIGKSILENLIEKGIHCISVNRSHQEPSHPELHNNFTYDLKHPGQIKTLVKEMLHEIDFASAKKIFLINNAAIIGNIGPISNLSSEQFGETLNINLVSPVILSTSLINAIQVYDIRLDIIHISSGAAFHPLEGLGAYCISKAGLEMASAILNTEHEARNRIKSITIGPGVVDTAMQNQLRDSTPEIFGSHEKFIGFKDKGLLKSPEQVGHRIVEFILTNDYQSGKYYQIDSL